MMAPVTAPTAVPAPVRRRSGHDLHALVWRHAGGARIKAGLLRGPGAALVVVAVLLLRGLAALRIGKHLTRWRRQRRRGLRWRAWRGWRLGHARTQQQRCTGEEGRECVAHGRLASVHVRKEFLRQMSGP